MDEHHYIVTFDHENDETYSGFIEHSNYTDRTTTLPLSALNAMALSGVSAKIHLHRHPDAPSGNIDDLINQDLITGFEHSVEVQKKKK